jgi:hypothetical protein
MGAFFTHHKTTGLICARTRAGCLLLFISCAHEPDLPIVDLNATIEKPDTARLREWIDKTIPGIPQSIFPAKACELKTGATVSLLIYFNTNGDVESVAINQVKLAQDLDEPLRSELIKDYEKSALGLKEEIVKIKITGPILMNGRDARGKLIFPAVFAFQD